MAIIDLTGRQFGRWTVLGLSSRRSKDGKGLYWNCECSCEANTKREVFGGDLKRGADSSRRGSLSCGCLMRELASIRSTKHGMAHKGEDHPGYANWKCARSRCNNPDDTGYYLYGARGIRVCERWDDFGNFWEDMGPTWQDGLTIDRINSNGNYEPENCRWSTAKEQANNRRTNIMIDTRHDGRMNVTQAAALVGIRPNTIFSRIRYGWDDADLLNAPRR